MQATEIVIPEITDLDRAFGGADEHLPKWSDLPDEFRRMRGPFCDAASMLFYKGGTVSDYGLEWKSDVDRRKALRLTGALLGSFAPKHEHKIGGVGFLLSQWCEVSA